MAEVAGFEPENDEIKIHQKSHKFKPHLNTEFL